MKYAELDNNKDIKSKEDNKKWLKLECAARIHAHHTVLKATKRNTLQKTINRLFRNFKGMRKRATRQEITVKTAHSRKEACQSCGSLCGEA